MKRVLIVVEGQTEEQFVKEVLQPHLWECGVHAEPTILKTKRSKHGADFKGGVTSYNQVRRDILLVVGDQNAAMITTMIDFYGLPTDFPGVAGAAGTTAERVETIEAAIEINIARQRFKAYLMIHEFEAMLFSELEWVSGLMGKPEVLPEMTAIVDAFMSPEDINDHPQTAPSKRLKNLIPEYQKTLHGPLVAIDITLQRIRERCSHFDGWLTTLEALGQ